MSKKKTDPQGNLQEQPANTEDSVIVVEPGNRVNYTMKDGQIRPLDIVRVWPDNMVNGVLLIDGGNDRENLPFLPEDEVSPHITLQQSPFKETPLCAIWATCIPYDETGLQAGTWHLSRDAGETAEETMTVDYDALMERITKIETENQELREMLKSLASRVDKKMADLQAGAERSKTLKKDTEEAPAP